MAKQTAQQTLLLTPEQLRNETVSKAFDQISIDGLQLLKVFESSKYRTAVTINHLDNTKYPNLVRENTSYFWNLTLSKNKYGNLIIYLAADTESISRFGGRVYNELLRSLFKHTSVQTNIINIEDSIRVSAATKEINHFFIKRVMEGESESVSIQALPYEPIQK